MDLKILDKTLSLSNFPTGLGGCRNSESHYDCCEYNITLFDNKKKNESVHEIDGEIIKLHHGSLSEINVSTLLQFDNMKILSDEQWHLRIFLSKVKEKIKSIANSYTQSCLVDAGLYATKVREKIADPLAPIWLKCSAYFLADAIFSINSSRPSPTHMLELIRRFEKNRINESFSIVHQCLGIERASTSLLLRMVKSTMGFSDIIEANGHSKIIQKKYDYLVQNSLLSDCYFYLGYINRNNVLRIKDSIHKNLEYAHILRVAFDTESDPLVIERQATTLLETTNEILTSIRNLRS